MYINSFTTTTAILNVFSGTKLAIFQNVQLSVHVSVVKNPLIEFNSYSHYAIEESHVHQRFYIFKKSIAILQVLGLILSPLTTCKNSQQNYLYIYSLCGVIVLNR